MECKDLVIALPSGKSLGDPTLKLFEQARIEIDRPHERKVFADVVGFPGISKALFFKPSQIPELVANGVAHIGLTGKDMVLERGFDRGKRLIQCMDLPFSRATNGGTRCVLFTKNGNKVGKVREIPRGTKIVTEYPKETHQFFKERGRTNIDFVESDGSTEALVANGVYDYGVALTETGTSLAQNDLKIIATIFESKVVLVAHPTAWKHPKACSVITFLGRTLEGVLRARSVVYITMNAPTRKVNEIRKVLPSRKSPTIQPLADKDYCAISSVVPVGVLNTLRFELHQLGATDIVELDALSIV